MIKIKPFLFIILFILLVQFINNKTFIQYVFAMRATDAVTVGARIGAFYLSVSGFASPFASIVLSSDGITYRSAVADKNGNFYISQILIKEGFSHFCLDVVDFKRIGQTQVCFEFSPAKADITMTGLFLPPTLGLERTQIAYKGQAAAFGYTMPYSVVTLHLSNGKTLTVNADATGYYEFILKDLAPGGYDLYTTASYNGKESLIPTKKEHIIALSAPETVIQTITQQLEKPKKLVTQNPLGPLWLVFPLLVLIGILLWKLLPKRITTLLARPFANLPWLHRKHLLHHAWFVGY